MANLTITETLYPGAVIAHVDEGAGILIAWNGSETYRVIRVDDNGWCVDVDVFTNDSAAGSITAAVRVAANWWKSQQEEA